MLTSTNIHIHNLFLNICVCVTVCVCFTCEQCTLLPGLLQQEDVLQKGVVAAVAVGS